ncbi:MAG: hypothetical protein ACRCXZ_06285 [Patescibacteria group bacterium]
MKLIIGCVGILSLGLFLPGVVVAQVDTPTQKAITAKNIQVKIYPSEEGLGDYATINYNPNTNRLGYKGLVTLRNGCEYIKSTQLSQIAYFAQPGPNDPQYSLNVVVGTNSSAMCTQVLRQASYWGSKTPVYFDKKDNLKKKIKLNYVYPTFETPWFKKLDFSKVLWKDEFSDQVSKNGVNYRLNGRVLERNSNTSKANCTGLRYGMIGPYCKYIEVVDQKSKKVISKLQTLNEFSAHFGKIQDLSQLQFVVNASSGNGFFQGVALVDGHFITRIQHECTTTVSYYEIDPVTYKSTHLLTSNSNLPAICE